MGGLSIWHILILAVFVLLLFGGSRFSSMMGDVAKGLKSFKQGMADDEDESRKRYEEHRRNDPRSIGQQDRPIDVISKPAEPTAPPPPPRDDETR